MKDDDNKNENPNPSISVTTDTSTTALSTAVLSNAIGSALAGIVSRIFTHPLDTIKARLQVPQNVIVSSTTAVAASATLSSSTSSLPVNYSYKGPMDVLYRTIQNEGIYGLYHGFNTVIIGGIPGTVCYFCTYEYMKESLFLLRQQSNNKNDNNNTNDIIIHFTSGMIAETIACIIYVPVDVIKERLQVQNHQQQPNSSSYYYKNGYDALLQISKTEGIRGIYKGYGATLASFGPFSALYFTLYEQMKVYSRRYIYNNNVQDHEEEEQQQQHQQQILRSTTVPQHLRHQQSQSHSQSINADDTIRRIGTPSDHELEKVVHMPFLYTLLCSTSAGAIASWCTSPLDMVKLRLQVNRAAAQQTGMSTPSPTKSSTSINNMNMISLLHNTIITEGVSGLFRGAGARVLHFTPATAITITLYETCRLWVYQILQPK